MNSMYDILNKINLLEGRGSKPDFLDLDRDGDRKEPMKKAAQDKAHAKVKEDGVGEGNEFSGELAKAKAAGAKSFKVDGKEYKVKEGSTGDYSAKKARAGKDIGKPGKQFSKIAADAAKRYGSKERGEKVAGAVLAKLRAKESVSENIDEAIMETLDAILSRFSKDVKAFRKGDDLSDDLYNALFDYYSDSGEMPYGTAKARTGDPYEWITQRLDRELGETQNKKVDEIDMNLIKGLQGAMSKMPRDSESDRNIHKKYGSRSDRDTTGDDDYDEWGNLKPGKKKQAHVVPGEKRGRGRPKGSGAGKSIGAKGPTGRSKLLTREEIDEAIAALEECGYMVTPLEEKAVSKAQRAAAGIAYAAKKGDLPKSELRGASKEMAKMASGELKKFAKTKEKDLPEKKKKEESVEETTVAGSVATAPGEAPKGKKGGMQFGKGVYEAQLKESFDKKLSTMLNEGMSISMSVGEDGTKNLSVNATDDDAMKLAQILKLAGMEQASGYQDACPSCGGMHEGQCGVMEEDYANSPDEVTTDEDYMTQQLSGGLNGPKTTGQTTVPVINRDNERQGVMGKSDTRIAETRLWDLYRKYETK